MCLKLIAFKYTHYTGAWIWPGRILLIRQTDQLGVDQDRGQRGAYRAILIDPKKPRFYKNHESCLATVPKSRPKDRKKNRKSESDFSNFA